MKITDKYVFFWKEWLSNWYRTTIEWDGLKWPTSEHVFMAMKAKLFNDQESYDKIQVAEHPREAQLIGRSIVNFDQAVWDEKKFDIMTSANKLKFDQNPELKERLLKLVGMCERFFVEASPYDKVWGIGMAEDHPDIENKEMWQGKNMLGDCLSYVAATYWYTNKIQEMFKN